MTVVELTNNTRAARNRLLGLSLTESEAQLFREYETLIGQLVLSKHKDGIRHGIQEALRLTAEDIREEKLTATLTLTGKKRQLFETYDVLVEQLLAATYASGVNYGIEKTDELLHDNI
ncbi:hypothetical protein CEB3_c18820 [Peptococcaceae bacterium CEB3]|nr:hypothetical protein CEB3_c18820 [Peptococcaceae bacterium CEB3]